MTAPLTSDASDTPAGRPGRAEQRATRIAFFIAGLGTAAWAPLVPYARARAGLDEAGLGLLLLCLGAGSLLAMPLAGALAARIGCRRVLVPAILVMCLALPVLASTGQVVGLAAALFVFGASVGAVDCTANLQAVIVERASGRTMMSGFHGLYSLGGIAGAGGVTALLAAGVGLRAATLVVVALVLLALASAGRHFLGRAGLPGGRPASAFTWPRGPVLLIGALCFVSFLAEGAMLDWSAVFLVATHGVSPSVAGLGYAAFAAAMTAARFGGDALVSRLSMPWVLRASAACGAAGLLLATLTGWWPAALAGYAMVGAGCANIVPVLYTAAGRQRRVPASVAVPAITTLGYAGILAGPALIGGAAHVVGLAAAFVGVAVLLLGVAACGGRIGALSAPTDE